MIIPNLCNVAYNSKRDFSKRDFILPQLNNTIKKYYIPFINLSIVHQHKMRPQPELLWVLDHVGGLQLATYRSGQRQPCRCVNRV